MTEHLPNVPAAPLVQSQAHLTIETHGPGFTDLTANTNRWLSEICAHQGLLTVFVKHTSASLAIQENADPDVQTDLLDALDRFAPQDHRYIHASEGPDDMPAHIKTMLTDTSLNIPVFEGAMTLGTWQGLFLVEHRAAPHTRTLVLNFIGTLDTDLT